MTPKRGGIYWVDLGAVTGSRPAGRRPVLVLQADALNRSKINTTVVATITSNLLLVEMQGNVLLKKIESGLNRDSVVNTTQVLTINKTELGDFVRELPSGLMRQIDDGVRLVLSL